MRPVTVGGESHFSIALYSPFFVLITIVILCLWTAGCFERVAVVPYTCKILDTFPNDIYYYGYCYYSFSLPLFSNPTVCQCGRLLLANSVLYSLMYFLETKFW